MYLTVVQKPIMYYLMHTAAFYRVAEGTIFTCPYWCYLLPRIMLRDSSYLDVIGSEVFDFWIKLLLRGSGSTTFYIHT